MIIAVVLVVIVLAIWLLSLFGKPKRRRPVARRGAISTGSLSPRRIAQLKEMAARAHAERACGHTPKHEDARAIAILRNYGID